MRLNEDSHVSRSDPCFNPRTRTGCDLGVGITGDTAKWFQSTHPHGVRLRSTSNKCKRISFQSTHPHGVRHRPCGRVRKVREVSIHAPARGATVMADWKKTSGEFQSTHPHGVRQKSFTKKEMRIMFQSTHPHGVRPKGFADKTIVHSVSNHAPARGATDVRSGADWRNLFQSTHPHGVRLQRNAALIIGTWFQSTHPHGVRHRGVILPIGKLRVSIHAPARGATRKLTYKSKQAL